MKSLNKTTTHVREDNPLPPPVFEVNKNEPPKLGKMKSRKALLVKKVKSDELIDEFLRIEKLKLDVEDTNELYLNTIVLKEVMQSAEKFFVYGNEVQRENMKEQAVLMLMSEYFNDSSDVLNRFREVMSKKIRKYGMIRRFVKRMYNRLFKKKNL